MIIIIICVDISYIHILPTVPPIINFSRFSTPHHAAAAAACMALSPITSMTAGRLRFAFLAADFAAGGQPCEYRHCDRQFPGCGQEASNNNFNFWKSETPGELGRLSNTLIIGTYLGWWTWRRVYWIGKRSKEWILLEQLRSISGQLPRVQGFHGCHDSLQFGTSLVYNPYSICQTFIIGIYSMTEAIFLLTMYPSRFASISTFVSISPLLFLYNTLVSHKW